MTDNSRLVFGVGINDVDYYVHKHVKVVGKWIKEWTCPYYRKWHNMLQRCFSEQYISKNPTYSSCTLQKEWHYFSNFIKWVDSQPNRDWVNLELDKDLLSPCQKSYSEDYCIFVSRKLNVFLTDRVNYRGSKLIGVYWKKANKNFIAQCSDPFTRKRKHLGCFNTEIEAHKAWQSKKHEYACLLADLEADERVAKALRERYAPDKDWTNR